MSAGPVGWPWEVLGMAAPGDAGAIRKAYAAALRTLDLDRQHAEYEALRDARDTALVMAANPGPADDDIGLGSFDADDDGFFDDAEWDLLDDGRGEWSIGASAGYGGDTAVPVVTVGEPDDLEETAANAAWSALHTRLFPGGDYAADAFELEDEASARTALDQMLDFAARCGIDQARETDYHIAEVLAQAWPRSAPLLEPANAAFGWLEQEGSIDERPALIFLNARLRGMRFHDAVDEPEHPLHDAWVELQRPGERGYLHRFRIKGRHVADLIATVRTGFPELEHFWDEDRVRSWERSTSGGGNWSGTMVLAIVILITVLRQCSWSDDGIERMAPSDVAEQTVSNAERDAAAKDLFGGDMSMAELRRIDSGLATQVDVRLGRQAMYAQTPRDMLRERIVNARGRAEFDDLVAIRDLQRRWLVAAQASSSVSCQDIGRSVFTGSEPVLDAEGSERERRLARRLLDKGLIGSPLDDSRQVGRTFQVPGWIVDRIANSGLGDERTAAALQDPMSQDRCAADIAMLQAIAERPADVPADLLREW